MRAMTNILNDGIIAHALRSIAGLALLTPAILSMTSCDSLIYDDMVPCESGAVVRFVYDYNMEYANAFHHKVDNLTILIYDIDGHYLSTHNIDKTQICDEDYRLTLDLPAGSYHMAAYGGIQASRSLFAFDKDPSSIPMTERRLRLIPDEFGSRGAECSEFLRPMFYGATILVVPEPNSSGRQPVTLRLVRNTNSFRILLQQINGLPLNKDDFAYEIIDDNILFDYNNALLPSDGITYRPWTKGEVNIGTTPAGEPWVVTYAELSTSRLIDRSSQAQASRGIMGITPGISSIADPRVRIISKKTGNTILDIPLIKYLELYKSDIYSEMPLQEFLDRQSSWDMVFFLDESQNWISSYIQVNGWTVRINDIEQ